MLHPNAGWYGRVLFLLAAGVAACNGDDTVSVPSTENDGTMEVVTTTTGTEIDPDGYTVQVDAQSVGPIGASATINAAVSAGDHTVQLTGLAANCTVTGENPRTVSVGAGETVTLSFAVSCGSSTGSLQVISSTSGAATDADGYTITVDGTDRDPIGVSAQVNVDGVTAGEHEVGLSGVSGNCQVVGDNPTTVTVAAGASTSASFAVVCAVPPANAGAVRVTTVTTGADLDPNGYRIAVDGGSAQPIGVNASTILTNVAAGAHSVRISGLSQNCTVQGSNPQAVTVTTGGTAELSFTVSCGATMGTIQVRTATTGDNPDPDGYTVGVDAGAAQPIGVNGTIQIPAGAGPHQVTLSGLASNCSVQGENPRPVTVSTGATVGVDFAVSCPSSAGSSWTTMTSGTTKNLRFVWGSSASNVFAAGTNDCSTSHCGEMSILHYDGAGWTTQYTHAGGVLGLWAAPSGEAFALAEGDQPGPILYYDGHQWAAMAVQPPPPADPSSQDITLRAIWGTSATDVFAAGSWFDGLEVHGYVVHYNGTQWSPMDLGGADAIRLSDVWGSSSTDVYAVGQYSPEDAEPGDERAVILHYNGTSWSEVLREGSVALAHIWGASATDVYATGSSGSSGAVWHYDGNTWSALTVPATSRLGPIWGSSSTDIYVVSSTPGKLWHYDGSTWKEIDTGSSSGLADIWGSSASDIFTVGSGGTILHGP
jgi:hypothetical protein